MLVVSFLVLLNLLVPCRKACKKCENSRPCFRCVARGVESQCVNSERKKRAKGTPRGPYKRSVEKEMPDFDLFKQKLFLPGYSNRYSIPIIANGIGLNLKRSIEKKGRIRRLSFKNSIISKKEEPVLKNNCASIEGLLQAVNSSTTSPTVHNTLSKTTTLFTFMNSACKSSILTPQQQFPEISVDKLQFSELPTDQLQPQKISRNYQQDNHSDGLDTLSYFCQFLDKNSQPI